MSVLNCAVVQLCSTQDVDRNLETIGALVREAASAGADFVALPENAPWLRTVPEAPAPVQSLDGSIIGNHARMHPH